MNPILVTYVALISLATSGAVATATDHCRSSDDTGCAAADATCCSADWLTPEILHFDSLTGDLGDAWSWSAGAQLRHRYMDESNRFRPGGPAASDYNLWRLTPQLELDYNEVFTGHIQAIDASAFGYDAPLFPLGIDQNRADLVQAWAEFHLTDFDGGGSLKYRYGRQTLKYGSQHLLSPLGWANTFRNFEGHRLMLATEGWSIDGFHMNSVNAAAGNLFRPDSFDQADQSRTISGVYASCDAFENNTLDLYWLWFQEDARAVNRMDGDRHTIGARLAGKIPNKDGKETTGIWNWDFEGAWQFGKDDFLTGRNQDVSAGFVSALSGYTFSSAPWSPTVNAIFYWGSGDSDPTDGQINTFFSLYPLGHAYWGIIDNFSGQNLIDFGVSTSIKPNDRLDLSMAWHTFRAASTNDFLYNIAGAPFALAPGERELGSEVDLIATLRCSENANVQVGYSWFFYGDAVDNSAFARPDASQLYVQTTFTF